MKSTRLIPHYHSQSTSDYSGPAIKVGPGVTAGEALQVAAQSGYRVVGGECASVGLGAGYSQGGGHSLLSSAYGLAADSVLEWEVVTADGQHLVATPRQNTDLYWALSGGGGGTFGVVLSMTAKVYPDGPVAGGSLAFTLADAGYNDTLFWKAVELWQRHLPSLVANNNTILYNVQNDSLVVFAFTLPDQSAGSLEALVSPFLAQLEQLGVKSTLTTEQSATYVEHFDKYLGPLPYGSMPLTMMSGRLVKKSIVQDHASNIDLVSALRSIVASGEYLVGCNTLSVAGFGGDEVDSGQLANSVSPSWRDAIALCAINAFWDYTAPLDQNVAVKQTMVNVHVPALEAATPGSGVYLNEIDPLYQGDWKQTIYGPNYDRLLRIKDTYDPYHVLYGLFAVGSESFYIDDGGRLCRDAQLV